LAYHLHFTQNFIINKNKQHLAKCFIKLFVTKLLNQSVFVLGMKNAGM